MKAQCVDSNQGTFHVDRVKTNYSKTGFCAGLTAEERVRFG